VANSEGGWISVNTRSLEDHTGAQRGRVIVFRDVTRNKRAEEELRESEARFRAIIDNSPALIFLKDVDGRYLLVNRRFEEVFHLASRDLIGKTDEDIFPPAQAAAFRANDRTVLKGGAPMEFEEVALHDDGPHTSIVVKFPLLNAQGGGIPPCAELRPISPSASGQRKNVRNW
jgi:PAS domain S-box-containing protein